MKSLITLLIWLTAAAMANASAPLQNTQAPGYYRMQVGGFEVTALSDGSSPLPFPAKQLLVNITPDELAATLQDSFLDDPVETSVNGFLVNTGTRLILIDTGAGPLLGPRNGKLMENLRAAGYTPEQVDEVYLTHMHGDHVGGLIINGTRAYPNATVRAARQEAEFWLSEKQMAEAPAPLRMHFQAAMAAIAPYQKADKFKPFDGETTLTPGVTAQPASGHTPGHTAYRVESNGQQLLVVGDLVHMAAVQFPHPSATVQFDTNQGLAASTRRAVFADASDHRYWIAGAHIGFPGVGHVQADGAGYKFVLANYSSGETAQPTPAAASQLPKLMDRDREIALALSSCPASVAPKAAVYVLEKSGYVKVRDSRNGFTAIVQHAVPTSQDPQCMDAEGTRTILPRYLKVAELRAAGKSPEEIRHFVADAFAKGIFQAPNRPGVDYMLSKENLTPNAKGDVVPFPPHVMFYAPYLKNADLGSDGALGPDGNPPGPAFVAAEGSPSALIIVPVGAHHTAHPSADDSSN